MPTHLPVEQVQALQAFYATRRQLAKRIEALSYDALELLRERGDQVSVPASLYDQGQLLEPCISKEVAGELSAIKVELARTKAELGHVKNELSATQVVRDQAKSELNFATTNLRNTKLELKEVRSELCQTQAALAEVNVQAAVSSKAYFEQVSDLKGALDTSRVRLHSNAVRSELERSKLASELERVRKQLKLEEEKRSELLVPMLEQVSGKLLAEFKKEDAALKECQKQLRSAQDELNYMEDLKTELEHQLQSANRTILELRQGQGGEA